MISTSSLAAICILALVLVIRILHRRSSQASNLPPLVAIPDEQLFGNPRHAYETALKQYGKIIGVPRKNRLEYIVDQSFVAEVLTNDKVYSFEHGTLSMLNLHILLALPRSFMHEIDRVVQDHIVSDLDDSVDRIAPVFDKLAKQLSAPLSSECQPIAVEIDAEVHRMMAEAMLTLILGEHYASATHVASTERIAVAIATLTGIFENMSWWSRTFPTVGRTWNWLKVMLIAIPYHFILGIGWQAFNELSAITDVEKSGTHKEPVIMSFARRFVDKNTHRISLIDRIWILSVILGLIFASVHQTAVVIMWVLCELAKRPEFVHEFRTDTFTETGADGVQRLTYASLQNAERLDSFIREVMRTKGDTLSTVRQTVSDTALAGYVIPKGSFVIPLATLANEDESHYGENAKEFVGDRWVGTGKPATMVSPNYFPFGLGRWACPGRGLAVAEIKLFILSIIAHANLSLENGEYKVVDPLNVTSVAPEGRIFLHPLLP
ncbi:Cytochrome P450 superfamily protein [Pleurotus pulmonarius]